MSEQNSREYYLGRSARSRELAADAVNAEIAGIHTEMAERYDWLANLASDTGGELRLVGQPLTKQAQAIWLGKEVADS